MPAPARRRAALAAMALAIALAPVPPAPAAAPPAAAVSATARRPAAIRPPPAAAAARRAAAARPTAAGVAAPAAATRVQAAAGVAAALAPPSPDPRVPPLRPPVWGRLVRGFEAPAGPYGPGHRGVDLRAPVGTPVKAPAAGRIRFAGRVAGSSWVSVLVAPGVVVTVGPLLAPAVAAGERVAALAPVGRLAAGHGGAVHLSLRVDGDYLDPLPWLVDRPRARLAPLPVTAA